jgi:hypothetical protein
MLLLLEQPRVGLDGRWAGRNSGRARRGARGMLLLLSQRLPFLYLCQLHVVQ